MKFFKVIGKIVELAIYTTLILMAVLVIASALPIPGGVKTFVVKSGSMEPAIKTGGIVTVLPRKDYNVSDVITFGPNTKTQVPTTHRIISESGKQGSEVYTTKGDNNQNSDIRQISQREVIGKVLFTVPYVGFAVAAAQKPIGFAVIVGVPALIFIGDQLLNIFREIKRMRERKLVKNNLGLPEDMVPRGPGVNIKIKK